MIHLAVLLMPHAASAADSIAGYSVGQPFSGAGFVRYGRNWEGTGTVAGEPGTVRVTTCHGNIDGITFGVMFTERPGGNGAGIRSVSDPTQHATVLFGELDSALAAKSWKRLVVTGAFAYGQQFYASYMNPTGALRSVAGVCENLACSVFLTVPALATPCSEGL